MEKERSFLQNEFGSLIADFDKSFKEEKKVDTSLRSVSYSLLGSPLFESRILMMGDNWGGGQESNQKEMPLVSDILAYKSEGGTYMGYFKFFLTLFDNSLERTVRFFENVVYTNGCLLRTKNESDANNKRIVDIGFKMSALYVQRIIEIVNPELILCFGNAVAEQLASLGGLPKRYWKDDPEHVYKTSSQSFIRFHSVIGEKKYEIIRFPHASRYNNWKSYIGKDNRIYELLRKRVLG